MILNVDINQIFCTRHYYNIGQWLTYICNKKLKFLHPNINDNSSSLEQYIIPMVLILEKRLQFYYTYYVGKILNYYIPNRID